MHFRWSGNRWIAESGSWASRGLPADVPAVSTVIFLDVWLFAYWQSGILPLYFPLELPRLLVPISSRITKPLTVIYFLTVAGHNLWINHRHICCLGFRGLILPWVIHPCHPAHADMKDVSLHFSYFHWPNHCILY